MCSRYIYVAFPGICLHSFSCIGTGTRDSVQSHCVCVFVVPWPFVMACGWLLLSVMWAMSMCGCINAARGMWRAYRHICTKQVWSTFRQGMVCVNCGEKQEAARALAGPRSISRPHQSCLQPHLHVYVHLSCKLIKNLFVCEKTQACAMMSCWYNRLR
jgi:hypothetical protein